MRGKLFVPVLAVAVVGVLMSVAAAASSGSSTGTNVRIVSVTPRVAQGGSVRLVAAVSSPSSVCTLSARGPVGKLARPSQRPRAGRVTWTLLVPPTAALGVWRIAVDCGKAGTAQATFLVETGAALPGPARVVLEQGGFSRDTSITTSSGRNQLDFGLVLRNLSADQDAIHVSLTINILDAKNKVVRSKTETIEAIPAAARYYYGDWIFVDALATPARVSVRAKVEASEPKAVVLPTVSGVHIAAGDPKGVAIEGVLHNTLDAPLSSSAITGVVFDKRGIVIGGGYTYPDDDVAVGGQTGFRIEVESANRRLAASARVSAEPNRIPVTSTP